MPLPSSARPARLISTVDGSQRSLDGLDVLEVGVQKKVLGCIRVATEQQADLLQRGLGADHHPRGALGLQGFGIVGGTKSNIGQGGLDLGIRETGAAQIVSEIVVALVGELPQTEDAYRARWRRRPRVVELTHVERNVPPFGI